MLKDKLQMARKTFEYKVDTSQDNLFSPNHVRYQCWFSVNEYTFMSFLYQCNPNVVGEPTFENVLGCVLTDASAVYNDESFEKFCDEFGYFPIGSAAELTAAYSAYKGCQRNLLELRYGFDDEDIEELLDAYFNGEIISA